MQLRFMCILDILLIYFISINVIRKLNETVRNMANDII